MLGPDLALAASNVLVGTAAGAGVSQSLFVVPQWFASPPESLAPVRDRKAAKFWIPLQAGALIALGTSRASARRRTSRTRRCSSRRRTRPGSRASSSTWRAAP